MMPTRKVNLGGPYVQIQGKGRGFIQSHRFDKE